MAKGEIDDRGRTTDGRIRERRMARFTIEEGGRRTTKEKEQIEKERERKGKGKREKEVTKNVNSIDTMFDRFSSFRDRKARGRRARFTIDGRRWRTERAKWRVSAMTSQAKMATLLGALASPAVASALQQNSNQESFEEEDREFLSKCSNRCGACRKCSLSGVIVMVRTWSIPGASLDGSVRSLLNDKGESCESCLEIACMLRAGTGGTQACRIDLLVSSAYSPVSRTMPVSIF